MLRKNKKCEETFLVVIVIRRDRKKNGAWGSKDLYKDGGMCWGTARIVIPLHEYQEPLGGKDTKSNKNTAYMYEEPNKIRLSSCIITPDETDWKEGQEGHGLTNDDLMKISYDWNEEPIANE